MKTCVRCRALATTRRLVRLQDREWLVPLCQRHGQILDRMLAAWIRDAEQLMPILLPPRLSPLWPPVDLPEVDRSQLGVLAWSVAPNPAVPRPVPPVPPSPRLEELRGPRLVLIEGSGPAHPQEAGQRPPAPELAAVPPADETPTDAGRGSAAPSA